MPKKYRAFISYSHQNEKFAQWLHRSLERYKIPKELRAEHPHLPSRLYPIFRDREELPSSSNLGSNILEALRNSEYLIVICSREAAKSFWVNQEIIDFKSLHGEDRVLAIILDGEPNALSKENFSDDSECFPEALKYKVLAGKLSSEPTEPVAADVRRGKDGYKFGKLKLIAGLLGIGLEELYQREAKRERKNRWIKTTLTLFILGVISLLALNLFFERNRAQHETKKVKELLFNGVIEKGFIYRDHLDNPIEAKFTFAKALELESNPNQKKSALILYKAIENSVILKSKEKNTTEFNRLIKESKKSLETLKEYKKYKLFSCGRFNLTFCLYNTNSQEIHRLKKPTIYYDEGKRILDQQVQDMFLINHGQEIVSWDYASNINFWSKESNSTTEVIHYADEQLNGIRFSKDEKEILSWGNDGKVKLWRRKNAKPILEFKHNDWVIGAIFSQSEKKILSWSKDGEIKLWSRLIIDTFFSLEDNSLLTFKHSKVISAIFIDNDTKVLSWGEEGMVKLWSIKDKKLIAILKHKSWIFGVKFIKEKREIVSWSSDEEVKRWLLKEKKINKVMTHKEPHEPLGEGSILSQDQQEVLSWSHDGSIKLWSKKEKKTILHLKHGESPIFGAKFSKDEKMILSWSADAVVKLWSRDYSYPLLTLNYNQNYPLFFLNDPIVDARFSKDEKSLLIIHKTGESIRYELYPKKEKSLKDYRLKLEEETGTYLNETGELKLLENLYK